MKKQLLIAAVAGIGSMYLTWNEKRKFERGMQKQYQTQVEKDMEIIQEELKKE